jgi:hypothetical protein
MMNTLAEIPAGLALLREAEAMAIEGAANIIAGENMVAIAVHRIATQKLYLELKDDNELPVYTRFEHYLPELIQKMGIGRSKIFNLLTITRIATGPTLNLSYEQFAELGGAAAFGALKDLVDYDQKTGEIKGFREDIEIPEDTPVGQFILEHMQQIAPGETEELNLSPGDYKLQLEAGLGGGTFTVIQWFTAETVGKPGIRIKYVVEKTVKGDVQNPIEGFLDEGNIPQEVMEDFNKRLKIVGRFKFEAD